MQLSEHFSLAEMTASATALAHGIDNAPGSAVVEALRALCVGLLEPLRVLVGRPVHVNSGYRCQELNRLVGGVASSQHVVGEAADVEVPGIPNVELALLIERSTLDFDQLIMECLITGAGEAGWIHVSYRPGANRRQVFSIGRG